MMTRRQLGTIILLTAMACSLALAQTQSIDRDNPTSLGANEIRGYGVGKKVEYYYTFLAGPGEVIITVDSGAKGSFSQLEVELFDLDAQQLALLQNLPYPGETSRKVKRVSFGVQQPVLLRIFLDREAAQYLVRVGGAVQVAGADSSFSVSTGLATAPAGSLVTPASAATAAAGLEVSSPATTPAGPAASSGATGDSPVRQPATSESVAPAQADIPATTAAGADTTPAAEPGTATPAKPSALHRLWLKLSPAGDLLGMAGVGSLHVEMKDGTVRDIGLSKIKRAMAGQSTGAPSDGSSITASGEDKLSGWQRLWLKVGSKGDIGGFNSRPLRLEMKDGTVEELGPGKVKKVSIRK